MARKKFDPDKESKLNIFYELLDLAILPAALMLGAKLISMAVLLSWGSIQFVVVQNDNPLFPFTFIYSSQEDRNFVLGYSNLFMFLVVLVGSMFVASKSIIQMRAKTSSHFVLKLAKYDLITLLASSYQIYKEVFVWGSFLVICSIYLLFSAAWGISYQWIAYISTVATLLYIWIVSQNIQLDLMMSRFGIVKNK